MSEEAHRLLHLELVAPSGPVFDGDVLQVILPGTGGEMGILPKHAPLVAQLAVGRMRVQKSDGEWLDFAVAEGFAKVQADRVVVLADSAQEASEIDVERVKHSMERPSSVWRCIAPAQCLRAKTSTLTASSWRSSERRTV